MADKFNNDRIKGAFGDSLRNPYEEVSSNNIDYEINAMLQAKKLNEYMKTKSFDKIITKGIDIKTQNKILSFQSTTVKFTNFDGTICELDISVPINFKGEIRIWTNDFTNKRVWFTVDKIYKSECNKDMLFDFFGKHTNRFTIDEMGDDLPF
jgi:hypothetical protein